MNNYEEENNMHETEEENSETVEKENSLESDIESCKRESAEWQDKYTRLYADFENFRKRISKERTEISSYVKSDTASKFIPILDDLERAIDNMSVEDRKSATFEGVKMLQSKFKNILHSMGVSEMEVDLGEDVLDPTKHEALTTISVEDDSHKGKIMEVVERGYVLNDIVIRFAKVIIGA